MLARVKETGEIVEVIAIDGDWLFCSDGAHYGVESLEGIDHEIDYYTRLEHTYAGMAMQGMLSNQEYVHSLVQRVASREIPNLAEGVTKHAEQLAHELVEKMKEKEEKK